MEKLNKKQILTELKGDISLAQPYKADWDVRRGKWVSEYNGSPYGNEVVGKASVVSRDIKKAAAGQHASIIDPFVSTEDIINCSPITAEDRAAATQAEILLNFQFCRDFNRYQFISNTFKVLQREGTVVAKVSWEREEEEIEVDVPEMEPTQLANEQEMQQAMQQFPEQAEQMQAMMQNGQRPFVNMPTGRMIKEIQTNVVFNRPTAELCRNSMLWVDPTAEGDIQTAQFVAYKFKSNMSELKKDGRYKNLDKIRHTSADRSFENDPYRTTDKAFIFSDGPREELDVIEYWGNYDVNGDGIAEPIVCTWVEDIIIRLEDNPYPDQKVPFVSCAFDAEPFSINGEANAELLSTDQKIKTGIKRALLDTLDSSTNGQKGSKKGAIDPLNLKKFREGKFFEYNGQQPDIWEGKFQELPTSVLNFYNLIDNDINTLTGVRGNGPDTSTLGTKTPQGRGVLDGIAKREQDISRNYNQTFLIPILRKWLSMSQEFMEEEQIIRITNDEFIPIKRNDVSGKIDIGMSVSTAAADAEKSSELAFLLQTTAQSLPFDLTKILLAEQAKLKGMPDLSKQILEYRPQPDPMEQQMKQLEMQKLQVEIEERKSRAMENGADLRLKEAKVVNEQAKARETHGKADINDLDYVGKANGQAQSDMLELENLKARNKMLEEQLKQSKPSN